MIEQNLYNEKVANLGGIITVSQIHLLYSRGGGDAHILE